MKVQEPQKFGLVETVALTFLILIGGMGLGVPTIGWFYYTVLEPAYTHDSLASAFQRHEETAPTGPTQILMQCVQQSPEAQPQDNGTFRSTQYCSVLTK